MRPHQIDFAMRVLRVFIAAWLVVVPALLAWGSFPQRQDAVIGLALLPLMLVGLLVPGMRIAMLAAGCWLIASPSWSYGYAADTMVWHDRILGLLCVFFGALPLPRWVADSETLELTAAELEPSPKHSQPHVLGGLEENHGWFDRIRLQRAKVQRPTITTRR